MDNSAGSAPPLIGFLNIVLMLPGHFHWFFCSLSKLIWLHAIEVVLFMLEGGSKICDSFIPPSLETWICICHVCCVWRCVWFFLTMFWTFSCGWRLPESLPRRLRHQQVENAAHPPHPVGSGTQFLCLLLRNSQLARQGLPIGKDGKHMHTLNEVASGFVHSLCKVLKAGFIV